MPYRRGNQNQITMTVSDELYEEIIRICEMYEWSINKVCTKLLELGIENAEEIFNNIKKSRGI